VHGHVRSKGQLQQRAMSHSEPCAPTMPRRTRIQHWRRIALPVPAGVLGGSDQKGGRPMWSWRSKRAGGTSSKRRAPEEDAVEAEYVRALGEACYMLDVEHALDGSECSARPGRLPCAACPFGVGVSPRPERINAHGHDPSEEWVAGGRAKPVSSGRMCTLPRNAGAGRDLVTALTRRLERAL
jgi:hypothetical protein